MRDKIGGVAAELSMTRLSITKTKSKITFSITQH